MSSFICPTCGLNNIDCGKAGYKTDREIELEMVLENCKELRKENEQLRKELSEHKEICCCFENEVLRLENAKLKDQLQKAEKTLQEIEGDWTTEETRIKISEYFNQQIGEKK